MQIVLALGANCGSELLTLKRAINLLPIYNKTFSSTYKSKPLLPKDAPKYWETPFFNMVMLGYSNLEPNQFLGTIKEIEISMGRCNKARWSPRVIDIDILFWGEQKIESEALSLPHTQMHHRDFVLVPMCDICPRLIHPTIKKSIVDITLGLREINLITYRHIA